MLARLEALGIVPWTVPQAGMFLWRRLSRSRPQAAGAGTGVAPGGAAQAPAAMSAFISAV